MPSKKQATLKKENPRKSAQKEKLAKARAARAARASEKASVPSATSPSSSPSVSVNVASCPASPTSASADNVASTPRPASPSSSAVPESASKRKLSYISAADVAEGANLNIPDTVAHLEVLQSLFENAVCGLCLRGTLKLCHDSNRTKGLSVGLVSVCQMCGAICGRANTSRKSSSQSFEVNRAMVAASLNVGMGHGGLTRFCEVLGVPSLHNKTYQQYVNIVYEQARRSSSDIAQQARSIVKDLYEPGADGIINISVTFDGTWHKRGHTSNHGAAVVICAVTGLVLDSHVMSLYCQVCKIRGSKARDPEEQTLWLMDHKESCHANYSGSSGGMEAEAAKVLWGRSMDYGLRYTTLIGDGDSKTFNAIQELNPYNGVEVKKAECVNHVAKRLGTALRNLVNTEKKRGVTLGGRGSGTLTQEKIGKLQSYYTKAVRSCNSSVEQMSNGVWAAFFHSTSSDDDPKHHFCPEGPDSWCFHNRAIARQEAPPSHAGRLMTALNCTVAPYVEQVYKRLTDSSLLEKCLLGVTQNQNESFHAQIWLRCPKHIFVTRPRIEVATSLAICEWNQGSVGTQKFMRNLGLCISSRSVLSGQKRDRVRVRKAEQAQMEPAKRRRTVRKCAAQRENQRRAQMERHPYESGAGGY